MNLSDLKTIADYQGEHLAQNCAVFPTVSSLQWFIRCNKSDLIKAKAILLGAGSRPTLLLPNFESVVLSILINKNSVESDNVERDIQMAV